MRRPSKAWHTAATLLLWVALAAPQPAAHAADDAVGVVLDAVAHARHSDGSRRAAPRAKVVIDLIKHFAALGRPRAERDAERDGDLVVDFNPVRPRNREVQPFAGTQLEDRSLALVLVLES